MKTIGSRFLILVCALVATSCSAEPPRPKSVVLITVDTLRADHILAGFGTPSMDRLAKDGTVFTRAFSASSSTAPSHASMLTGLYPSEHTVGTRNAHHLLHPAFQTLAEVLGTTGRRTGAVVSNPVLGRELGLDQGFELYDDAFEGRELNRDRSERTADRAVDLAIDWLGQDAESPFFLWLHLQDPHGPYLPPDDCACETDTRWSDGRTLPVGEDHSGHQSIPAYQAVGEERTISQYTHRYACEVRHIDHHLGRFLRHLDEQGLRDEVLIVLTSDHGEAFGEDDFWFAHGHSVGRDQVHVPLLLAGPRVPEASLIDTPVSNVSIYATVLDALDLFPPEPVVGPSLLALAADPNLAEPIYVESINQVGVAWRNAFLRRDRQADDEDLFAGLNPNSGGFWKPLETDHVELLDPLAAHSTRAAQQLEELLDGFVQRLRMTDVALDRMREEVPVTEEDKARLSALGYIR